MDNEPIHSKGSVSSGQNSDYLIEFNYSRTIEEIELRSIRNKELVIKGKLKKSKLELEKKKKYIKILEEKDRKEKLARIKKEKELKNKRMAEEKERKELRQRSIELMSN